MKIPGGCFSFQEREYEYPEILSLEKAAELFRKTLVLPEYGCWCGEGVRGVCAGKCEKCLLCSNAGEKKAKTAAFRRFCQDHGIAPPEKTEADTGKVIPAGEFRYGDLRYFHPAVTDPAVLAEEYGKALASGKMDAAWCRDRSRGDCSDISCRECLFCASNGSFLRKRNAFEAFCLKHGISLPVREYPPMVFRANLHRNGGDFFMPAIRDTRRMVQDFAASAALSPHTACWCRNCLEEECAGNSCRECLLCSNFGNPRSKIKYFLLYCRLNGIRVPEFPIRWEWKIPAGKFLFEGQLFFYPDIADPAGMLAEFASRLREDPRRARWCGVNITSCRNTFDCRECLLDHSEGPVPLKLRAFEAFCREKKLNFPSVDHKDPEDWIEAGTFLFEEAEFSWPFIPSGAELAKAFESECRHPSGGTWCPENVICPGDCGECVCAFTSEDPDRKLRAFRAFAADHGVDVSRIPDPDRSKRVLRGTFEFDGMVWDVPFLSDGIQSGKRFSEGLREGKLFFCWCGKEGTETCGDLDCGDCIFCSNCGWTFRKLLAYQAFCREKGIPLECVWTPPEPAVPGGTIRKGKTTFFWPDLLYRTPSAEGKQGNPCMSMVLKCSQKCGECLLSADPGEPPQKQEARSQWEQEWNMELTGPEVSDAAGPAAPDLSENGLLSGGIIWEGKNYGYPDICSRDRLIREFRRGIRDNVFEAVWCGNGVKKNCGGQECTSCLLCSSPDPFRKIGAFLEVLKRENIPVPDTDLEPVPDIRKCRYLFEGHLFEVPDILSIHSIFRVMRQNLPDCGYDSFCLPWERERCSRNCRTCLLCTNFGAVDVKFRAWKQFLEEKNIPFPRDCDVSFTLEIPPGEFTFEGRRLRHPGVSSRRKLAEAFQQGEGDRLLRFSWCRNGGAGNCSQPEQMKCGECLFSSDQDENPVQRIRAFLAFCRANGIPVLSDQSYPEPQLPAMTFQLRKRDAEWRIPPILNLERIGDRFKASLEDRSCLHTWWCSPADAECCSRPGSDACTTCLLNSAAGLPGEKMLGMSTLLRKNGIPCPDFPQDLTEISGGTVKEGEKVWHFPPIIRKKNLADAFRMAMKECPLSSSWCRPEAAFLCPEDGCVTCLLCTNIGDAKAKLKAFQAFCRHAGVDISGISVEKKPEIPGGIFRHQKKNWKHPDIFHAENMADAFEDAMQNDPQNGRWCLNGIRGPCSGNCDSCLLCSDERYPFRKIQAFLAFCRKHGVQGDPLEKNIPGKMTDYEERTDSVSGKLFRIPPVFHIRQMKENFVREIVRPYSACWCRGAVRGCAGVECSECLLCSNRGDPEAKYRTFLAFCQENRITLPETHPDFSLEMSSREFRYEGKLYYFPGITHIGSMLDAFRESVEFSPWRAVWCSGIAGPCEGNDCGNCLLCSNIGDAEEKIRAFEAFCREAELPLPPVKLNLTPAVPGGTLSGEGMTLSYPAVRDPLGLTGEFVSQIRSGSARNRRWCGRHTEPCGRKECADCLFSSIGPEPEKKVNLFEAFCREHQWELPELEPDFSAALPSGDFIHKRKKWHYPELSSPDTVLDTVLDHLNGPEPPECLCAGAVSCEPGPLCLGCLFHGGKKIDRGQLEAILAFVHEKSSGATEEIDKP